MTTDMTRGKPLRLILGFALPLLLGALLQQSYNIADAVLVGRILGANSLAAVGCSSSIQLMLLNFVTGSCSGLAVPVARSFGACDRASQERYLYQVLVLGIGLAAASTLLMCAALKPCLALLRVESTIYAEAQLYLLVIFLGLPFTWLYNLMASLLRAVGDSRTPFVFLSVSTVLNIGLDWFCLSVLSLGVAGAALATIASQALSGLACLLYTLRKYDLLCIAPENRGIRTDLCGEVFGIAVPMGLQNCVLYIGIILMQSANNSLGAVYTTALTAGTRIKSFSTALMDAVAMSVSVFCSQNLGARRIDRIRTGIRDGMLLLTGYGIFLGVFLTLFGRAIAAWFVGSDAGEVLDYAQLYTLTNCLMFWFLPNIKINMFSLQGMGCSKRTIPASILEMVLRIAVCYGLLNRLGYLAICVCDPIAWIGAVCYILPCRILTVRRLSREMEGEPVNA